MATRARRKEWFDDDSFWRELYPFIFTKERLAAGPEDVEKAVALARAPDRRALDLCCGPGRCSIPLARLGFTVTGVDRTRYLLDKGRSRARRAGVKIEWVQADMRDFVREEAFDIVLSMFTSFGYFDVKQEDLTVLGNVLTSLKPGGVLLMELAGKEFLAGGFQPVTMSTLPDGSRLVHRHEIFDDWTRLRNEWILVRKGRTRTFQFHHTIYSGQELKDRLLATGFHEVRLFGSLEGAPYDIDATRLVAVARKASARARSGSREPRASSTRGRSALRRNEGRE